MCFQLTNKLQFEIPVCRNADIRYQRKVNYCIIVWTLICTDDLNKLVFAHLNMNSIRNNFEFLSTQHYVKSVRIRSYSGPYFPAFGLNTGDKGYLSLFSLNARKHGPE